MFVKRIKYLIAVAMEIKAPLYLTQPNLYNLNTRLVGRTGDLFEFEDTIFHLQGGGQPDDKGYILFQENKLDILGGTIEKETGTVLSHSLSFAISCRLGQSCLKEPMFRCTSIQQ